MKRGALGFSGLFSFDPRWYQITVLSGLLIYGLIGLDLEVRTENVLVIFSVAFLTQYFCTLYLQKRKLSAAHFEGKSVFISALSLSLLLRSNSLFLLGLGAFLAISSKFFIRLGGKHVFNPTNLGIALLIILTNSCWVSPGQWGASMVLASFVSLLGLMVVRRAARSDVTLAWLLFYGLSLLGRSLQLGDPLTIPLHQVENGAFIIFSFFMISDPKTTPNSRAGRIVFAFLVAVVAYVFRFKLFNPNALILALFIVSFFTPIIDVILPGKLYFWKSRTDDQTGGRTEQQDQVGPALKEAGKEAGKEIRKEVGSYVYQ